MTRGILTLSLLLICATPIAAQQHGGFWWTTGVGYGIQDCGNCYGDGGGVSGSFALGGTAGQRWLVGIGSTAWTRTYDDQRHTILTFELRSRFYPAITGFFLAGGLGAGVDLRRNMDGAEDPVNAVVFSLGLGYDLPLSGTLSLTPFVNGYFLRSNTPDKTGLGQAGIGITFR